MSSHSDNDENSGDSSSEDEDNEARDSVSQSSSSSSSVEEDENDVAEIEVEERPLEVIAEKPTKKGSKTNKTISKRTPKPRTTKKKGDINDEGVSTPVIPKKKAKRPRKSGKGFTERTETLHCIDVVTYPSPSGLDIACLIMVTKAKAMMKMYCVRLDTTTRHMTSPFYEHKVFLVMEDDYMSLPASKQLKCYTGLSMYNVHKWIGTAYRLGPDPEKMKYVPSMNSKVSAILRETFFFYTATSGIKTSSGNGTNDNDNIGGGSGIVLDDDDDDDNNNNDDNIIDGNDLDDSEDSSSRHNTRDVTPASTAEKNDERARIINLLLPDPALRRPNNEDHNTSTPMALQNNPLCIRWHDTPGALRKLEVWLHRFEALGNFAKEDKKLFSDHSKFWATIDNDPARTTEITDFFYHELRPKASYTETGSELYLTPDHIRRFVDTWQPFFLIRVFLCNNLDTMPDLFYIHHHLHTHYDGQITLPFESYTHNDMSDMAQLMQHIERLFAHNLPATTINTASATTGNGGATSSLISLTTNETKYYDHKKLMVNANRHIQQIVDAYGVKFAVTDTMLHRIIKMSILQHMVVPYIIGEIDSKAKSDYTFNRSTCHTVTLSHIMHLYTELFGITVDEETPEYQKNIRLILNTIKERENVQFKGDTSYVDLYNLSDEHRYTLKFLSGDMCQIMTLLYRDDEPSASVITRTIRNQPWRPVFDSTHRVTSEGAVNPKRITLFRIAIADTNTASYEEAIHTLTSELFIDDVQVFGEIDSLLVSRITSVNVTPQRINVAISSPADMLAFKDAKLIHQVIREQPANTIVIVSANISYTRGMLPRFFTLQGKMPQFYSQYCVTIDQLVLDLNTKKKTYIVIPYLHLLNPKEMYQILTWFSSTINSVKRVFITGCLDILAATPGQVFIDLVRCIDYGRFNQLLWDFQRPCDAFNTVIQNHWRIVELSERTSDMVTRFMQSFHRMTTTVCHGIKDLWHVKDYPTLAFFIATIVNKVNQRASPLGGGGMAPVVLGGVPIIRRGITTSQMPDYTYAPFKSIGINMYNRYGRNNKSVNILKESMRNEIRTCTMNEVIVSYNDPTTSVDTIQLDRYLTGYSVGYDEIKHINRHIYVITMADVLKLSRNELHTLFCMVNNVFIVDNPFTPYGTNTSSSNYPLKTSSSSLPPPYQWHCCTPNEIKDRIYDQFVSQSKFASCRYTHESYVHDLNLSPMMRINYNNNNNAMIEDNIVIESTTKRKRDMEIEEVNEEEEEEEEELPKKKTVQKKKKSRRS